MSVVLSEECVRRRVLGPRTAQDGRTVWVVARGLWVECECLSPEAAAAALKELDGHCVDDPKDADRG